MASVDVPAAPPAPAKLWTVAELAALPDEGPDGPVLHELDNGRLITMPPPGDIHGGVENKWAAYFFIHGELPGHGKARCGDVGIILWRNPDRVVGADAAFIANRSLPIRRSPEGYLETIPDLVVEVRSKNDTGPEIATKVADYLRAGVRLVWVADPARRIVTAYRPGQPEVVLTDADTLSAPDIIPGFQLAVAAVFAE
jgi:Uma2 family endonuclease